MFDLSGKKALVTGASGGLGGAIARAFHGQGAEVALSGTKVAALEKAGVEVVERAPIIAPPLATTADYLRTKRDKMGHLF